MNNSLVAIVLGLSCLYPAFNAFAGDLQEILESNTIQRYKNEGAQEIGRLTSDKWLDKDSNFSILFNRLNSGFLKINLWFAPPAGSYRANSNYPLQSVEHVGTLRNFRSKSDNEFKVKVMVPHPRYQSSAELGLIKEFSKHSPPSLKIDFSEELEITRRKAMFYTRPDKTCQLNFSLAKGTLVVFEGKCSDSEELKKFAESFSFDRFEMKLNT